MADDNDAPGRRRPARALTEKALQAEQAGDQEKAEALFAEAEKLDPEEVLAVVQEQTDVPAHNPSTPAPRTGPAATFAITLSVNGKRHEVTVDARTTLLDALRDRLAPDRDEARLRPWPVRRLHRAAWTAAA